MGTAANQRWHRPCFRRFLPAFPKCARRQVRIRDCLKTPAEGSSARVGQALPSGSCQAAPDGVRLCLTREVVMTATKERVIASCSSAGTGCHHAAPRGHALRRYVRAYGDAHRPPIAQTEPSSRGTSGRSDTGWVSSPSKPGSETLGNGTYATAGRGGRLRHARGYAPPRIHRRGW